MKKGKKFVALGLVGMMALSLLGGCGQSGSGQNESALSESNQEESGQSENNQSEDGQKESEQSEEGQSEKEGASDLGEINVISREDGSGTRGAFIELFGIEEKNEAGEKVDNTTDMAAITNSTAVMMQSVAGDLNSIGYISLGSMNDTVKAVKIDGVEATVDNIKKDTYKIARPFNIVTQSTVSEPAQDFIDFIMSADGQQVIEEDGYIRVSDLDAYSGGVESGKIVVSGSSSVTPVMEKLKEAYLKVNPGMTIEIQQSDSSTGVSNAIDGACDIGMASRELKDSETEKGIISTVIAMDGIAVIVNKENGIEDLTSEQVKEIFTGNAISWSDIY